MTKLSLMSNTLATSLVPFVDTIAAFARKDRKTAIKMIVACEIAEVVFLVALAFAVGKWVF
jgi:hypothetical protein